MKLAALLIASIFAACGGSPEPKHPVPDKDPDDEQPVTSGRNDSPPGSWEVAPTKVDTAETRCAKTRAARVTSAKTTIQSFRARKQELAPLTQWTTDHKCELKDSNGKVAISEDAGADDANPDEVACDTPKLADGLTPHVMREILVHASIPQDEIMFHSFAECDAIEKPSLNFRYADASTQDAILALP